MIRMLSRAALLALAFVSIAPVQAQQVERVSLYGTLPAFATTPTVNVGATNGIALDATVIARLGTLGQKTMAGSAPVTIASDQSTIPVASALDGAAVPGSPISATAPGVVLTLDTAGIDYLDTNVASLGGLNAQWQVQGPDGSWSQSGVTHYFLPNAPNGDLGRFALIPGLGTTRVPVVGKVMRLVLTGTATGTFSAAVTSRVGPWIAPWTWVTGGTITANLGTLNGAALDASVQALRTALGAPFQAGGSIGNTGFGITGTLPAFAVTPTFNLGTLNGASTAANQASEIAALGTPADAAFAGSGNSGIVGLGKGQYAILSSILTTAGSSTDTAAAATGANGTNIALLKALRDKLNGSVAVTGTFFQAIQPTSNPIDGAAAAGSPFTISTATTVLTLDTAGITFLDTNVSSMGGMNAQWQTQGPDGSWNQSGVIHYFMPNGANGDLGRFALIPGTGVTRVPVVGKVMRLVTLGTPTGNFVASVTTRSNAWNPPWTWVTGGSISSTIKAAGTNRSATIGTTAVTLMAANTARQGWKIRNDTTGDVWINFDTTATAVAGGGNIRIPAGTGLASEPGFVETGSMSAIGSAAGLAITAREH